MDFFFLNNELFILAIFINIIIEIFKPFVPRIPNNTKLGLIETTIIRLMVLGLAMGSCYLLNKYNIKEYTFFDGLITAILSFGFYEIGFKQLKNGLYNFFRRRFGVAVNEKSNKEPSNTNTLE